MPSHRPSPGRADPAAFTAEILPGIRGLSSVRLAKATGLSRAYSLIILRERYVPRRRHWEALRAAASAI